MEAIYLLDTNTVSYFIANRPPQVRRKFENVGAAVTAISVITEAELWYGATRIPGAIRRRLAIELFLASANILPWDSDAAHAYGNLRAEQERIGRPMSVEDLMIAAHALSRNLILVTSDNAFAFVSGLRSENWTTI